MSKSSSNRLIFVQAFACMNFNFECILKKICINPLILGMNMTKQPLIFIFAAVIALGGCTMSGGPAQEKNKVSDQLTFPPPPDEPRFYFERSIHSSSDVLPDTESDALRRTLTGEHKRGEGLSKPYSVAVLHGRVWVGGIRHSRAKIFQGR
jgi:hypothetical protein